MKISIAMATYNGAKYIEAQLQSFITQAHLPDELVVSDDNSTDSTVAQVEAFAKYAPFPVIIVRNRKNLGYAGNFNTALERTTGDLVFLSDQDDIWFPEKLENMLILSQCEPDYLLYMNDALLTDGELNSVNLTKYGQIKSAGLSNENFVMGCCCAIKRELLDFALPIPNGLKSHDCWLVEIADGISAKRINKDVLQYYRRHDGNVSQFIANRLSPISRWSRYIDGIINAFRSKKSDGIEILSQASLFLDGLISAQLKVPAPYQIPFEQLVGKHFNEFELLKKRIDTRESFFLVRILKVTRLILSDYPNGKRISYAMRDLLG